MSCGGTENDIADNSFSAMVMGAVYAKGWDGESIGGEKLKETHQTELCNFRAFWGFGLPVPRARELVGRLEKCAGSKFNAWDLRSTGDGQQEFVQDWVRIGDRLRKEDWRPLFEHGGNIDSYYKDKEVQCCSAEPDGEVCCGPECCPTKCCYPSCFMSHTPLSTGGDMRAPYVVREEAECSCCCSEENQMRYAPPGYWSDVWYYVYNYHPIISILPCCHSSVNRLGTLERICMELMTFQLSFGYSYFARNLMFDHVPFLGHPLVFYGIYILISLIAWDVMFYIFAAPCLIGDGCCGSAFTWLSELFGYIIFLAVMFLSWILVWNKGLVGQDGSENDQFLELLQNCLFSRYVISLFVVWPIILSLRRFNLYFAWGDPDQDPYKASTKGLFDDGIVAFVRDRLKIGHWKIQKQQFQNACIRALRIEKAKFIESDIAHLGNMETLATMDPSYKAMYPDVYKPEKAGGCAIS